MTRETAQALYDAHRSTAVVARVIGKSQAHTCRLLKSLGVKMRPRGGDNMPKKYHNRVGAEVKECREPHLAQNRELPVPYRCVKHCLPDACKVCRQTGLEILQQRQGEGSALHWPVGHGGARG